jgi:hypothetical protein
VESLYDLNGDGLGVFIAPTTILVLAVMCVDRYTRQSGAHQTLHCSLSGACHVS